MKVRRRAVSPLRGVGMACGLVWVALLVVGGSPGRGDAQQPGIAAFDDRWLAEVVGDELKRFTATGEYPALAGRMKNAILARVACRHLEKLSTLNDMMYVFRACAYLPLAEETTGGKEFARWLLEHKEVSRRLFRAMEDVDKPADSLKKLRELVLAEEKAVLAYPDLSVAFATSLPLRHYRKQPKPCSMIESFRYYTQGKTAFRYDLKKMPYGISRYLADTRLNLKERRWAVKTYAKSPDPARCYFDLKYDFAHFRKEGTPKKIALLPYTLQNLRRAGGVCIEQAYYSAEVCKALGVPATIVTGHGKSGIGHAWLACLKLSAGGKRVFWDSATGRYQTHRYYTGEVRAPNSGRKILDNELMLVGSGAQLPLKRREEADTAVALARLVDRTRDRTPSPDPEALRTLAVRYNRQIPGGSGKAKASTEWIAKRGKLDQALVEDLIAAAVDRNLAFKPAWELIIQMRKSNRLPVDRLDRFFDLLIRRTAKAFPDYSCSMVMRIVPTIPDVGRREKTYRKALGVYGSRPDLYGRILMAVGDDYRGQEKKKSALRAYERAAMKCVNVAEVVLAASARAEGLLIEARRTDMAITMYKKLFAKARKRKTAFRTQTVHYQLGMRLVQLLRDEGRHKAADQILKKL